MPNTPKKSVSKKAVKQKFIYWCHTNLPEDYIFIYGTSELQVKRKYHWLGGFEGVENIIAHKICELSQSVQKEMKIKNICDIAEDELVLKTGIEYLHKDGSAFRYNGKVYREAGVFDNRYSKDNLTVYLFKVKEKMRYKIGHTKNVSRRLKELSKPDQLEIVSTISTLNAKKIETELLAHFKKFQIYNEYLELDDWGSFLLWIMFKLYCLEFSESNIGHIATDMFKSMVTDLKQLIDNHTINGKPSKDEISKAQEADKFVDVKLDTYSEEKRETYYKKIGLDRIMK